MQAKLCPGDCLQPRRKRRPTRPTRPRTRQRRKPRGKPRRRKRRPRSRPGSSNGKAGERTASSSSQTGPRASSRTERLSTTLMASSALQRRRRLIRSPSPRVQSCMPLQACPPPPPLLLLHPNIGVHKPPCMESHDAYKSSASLINCSPLPPPCSSSGKSADMCIIICRPGPYIHPVSKHSCILDDTTTKLSDLHARLSIQLSLHPILITTASPSAYNVAAQDIIM